MATCWNNGSHNANGSGYGIKLTLAERDSLLDSNWETVDLELPNSEVIKGVNCSKASMWHGSCRELIHREIGLWMRNSNIAPWEKGSPPKLRLARQNGRLLSVFCIDRQ